MGQRSTLGIKGPVGIHIMDTDTVTVTYGSGSVAVPEDAIRSDITPYMWPGHYGEWDEAAQAFTAWALVSPSEWRVTSEIRAPPAMTCLAVGATVSRWRFARGPQEWFVESRRSSEPELPMQTCQGSVAVPEQILLISQDQLTQPIQVSSQVQVKEKVKAKASLKKKGPEQVQAPVSQMERSAIWRIHTHRT